MINIDSDSLKKIDTGGGNVFVLTPSKCESLTVGGTVDHESISHLGPFKFLWDTIKDEENISVALHKDKYTFDKWYSLVIVKLNDGFQRASLLTAKCSRCDWEGWVATPLSFDIYTGDTEVKKIFFDKAKRTEILDCPKCDGKLDKHAIWVKQKV